MNETVINQNIAKMAKLIDQGATAPLLKPTRSMGDLQKELGWHRDMIYVLYTHLSKKDRIAFNKRFYDRS